MDGEVLIFYETDANFTKNPKFWNNSHGPFGFQGKKLMSLKATLYKEEFFPFIQIYFDISPITNYDGHDNCKREF